MKKAEEIEVSLNGEDFFIRPVSVEDVDELHSLDILCFPEGRAFTKSYFHILFLYHNAFGWAFVKESSIAAFVLITANRKRANISTIDVHPKFQGKGLGSRLMNLTETALKEMGIVKCTLQVAVSNAGAIRLYTRLGYRITRQLRGYYAGDEDGYLMEKNFDD